MFLLAGRYEVKFQVGAGSFGQVFLAQDSHDPNGRQVAIKTMALHGARDAQRFRAEARALAALQHPNIVRVLDLWDDGSTGILVMEFLQGHTLANRVGQIAAAEMIDWAIAICDALDYAHRRDVVHRDLGPRNVFICDPSGTVKVIDFGLAVTQSEASGTFAGTPAFMAPEQFNPPYSASPKSDLFSLGAMIYYLFSGKLPQPTRDDRYANFSAPVLIPILQGLLEEDPGERYASAHALADDLNALKEALSQGAPPPPARRQGALQINPAVKLVARADARSILDDALLAAWRGNGTVVTCAATSGLGKSSLMQAFTREATRAGAICLHGGGLDLARSLAYGALKEALGGLIDLLGIDVVTLPAIKAAAKGREAEVVAAAPELKQVLPETMAVYGDGEIATKQRALELARFFLGLASNDQPVILWIDDVQWVDESTWRVLVQLAAELARLPFVLLLTAREEGSERLQSLPAQRVDLAPLSAPAIASLLEEMFAGRLQRRDEAAAFVAEAAGGNPFFVWEVCRGLVDAGAFFRDDEEHVAWNEQIAARVVGHVTPAEFLQARLQRLSPRELALLGRAAVWGRRFDARVVGDDTSALGRLIGGGFVDKHYTFTHDKLRETAAALMPEGERRRLNAEFGELRLADGGEGFTFAVEHFVAAGDLKSAAHAAKFAATDAETRQAFDAAYDFYRRLREWNKTLALPADEEAELLRRMGQVALRLGRYHDVVEVLDAWFEVPAKEVRDAVLRAQSYGQQAEAHLRLGDVDNAIRLHEAACATLGVRIPKARVPLIAYLLWQFGIAFFLSLGGRRGGASDRAREEIVTRLCGFVMTLYYSDSVRCLAAQIRAVNAAERLGDCRPKIQIFGQHAATRLVLPIFTRRFLKYGALGVSMAQKLGDAWSELYARTYLMFGFYGAGQFEAALAQISAGEALARKVRDPLLVGLLRQHAFFIRQRRGELTAAEELANEVRALYETYKDPLGVLDGNAYLPQLLADMGRSEQALALAQSMAQQAMAQNAKQEIVESSGQVAYVAWTAGDNVRALKMAEESHEASWRFNLRNVHIAQVGGRLLLALAENGKARLSFFTRVKIILTWAYGVAISPAYRAFNLWAAGRFFQARHRLRLAAFFFDRAVRSGTRAETKLDAARAERDLAFLKLRQGAALTDVEASVANAWMAFDACGAKPDAEFLSETWVEFGGGAFVAKEDDITKTQTLG